MITDLEELRRLAADKQAENVDFRRYVESRHLPPEPFRIIAAEVEKQTDCTVCANCCRHTVVNISEAEIGVIAVFLRMLPDGVRKLYTILNPEDSGERFIVNEPNGCTFLDGNLCTIYEARPGACRNFPAISSRRASFGKRMATVCARAWLCPIIYNSLERYKDLTGFRSRMR